VVGVATRTLNDDHCADHPRQQQRSPAVRSVTAPATSGDREERF
jgi:hypothetical protein